MAATRDIYARVPMLIENFSHYVSVFLRDPPFRKAGQLEYHLETIRLRKKHGSVTQAIRDDEFIESLYRTLQAWGIGARASNLLSQDAFAAQMRAKGEALAEFENLRIDTIAVVTEDLSRSLWKCVNGLGIVTNNATVVAGTKALHHIFPELIVPVDRAYTQQFFGWDNPAFQYGQANVFQRSFRAFVKIAKAVDLSTFLDSGWCSSRTKVIDNAIVGMVTEKKKQGR